MSRPNNHKDLLFQNKGDEKSIYERIKDLEFKESELLKEAHELREQNDLLEFRIVELEESHDKVRLYQLSIYSALPGACTGYTFYLYYPKTIHPVLQSSFDIDIDGKRKALLFR